MKYEDIKYLLDKNLDMAFSITGFVQNLSDEEWNKIPLIQMCEYEKMVFETYGGVTATLRNDEVENVYNMGNGIIRIKTTR